MRPKHGLCQPARRHVGRKQPVFVQPRPDRVADNGEPVAKGDLAVVTVILGAQAQARGAASMPGRMRSIEAASESRDDLPAVSRQDRLVDTLPSMATVRNLPLGTSAVCSNARCFEPYSMKYISRCRLCSR